MGEGGGGAESAGTRCCAYELWKALKPEQQFIEGGDNVEIPWTSHCGGRISHGGRTAAAVFLRGRPRPPAADHRSHVEFRMYGSSVNMQTVWS